MTPRRIVLIYLLVGFVWIVGTDLAVTWWSSGNLPAAVSVGKGLFFVSAVGVLLYFLIRSGLLRTQRAQLAADTRLAHRSALASLGEQALAGMELPALREEAVRLVRETLRVDCCIVARLSPDGLRIRASSAECCPAGDMLEETVTGGLGAAVCRETGPLVIDDLARDARFRAPPALLRGGVRGGVCSAIREDEEVYGVLGVFRRDDRWFTDDDVAFVGSVASLLGLTGSRERIRRALRHNSELLQQIVDHVPVMFTYRNPAGDLVWVNKAFEKLFGWALDDLHGRDLIVELYPEPEEQLRARRHLDDCTGDWGVFRPQSRDGDRHDVTWSVVRLSDGARVTIGQDLTALRQLEAQLLHAQKMEAVGRLAGGVAHDFNNILTAIMGNVELTLATLDAGAPNAARITDSLEQINRAGQRAANLTRQLLAFSRRQVMQPTVLDLNAVLGDMTKMVQRLIGENVRLRMEFDAQLGPVYADAGQIEQVIMNLAANARDAMKAGGELRICTRALPPTAGIGPESPRVPAAMIEVTDTGEGIAPEIQPRIFEPFFTTKPAGQGTGLGLPTSFGIVQQFGGRITVESVSGQGATFRVVLPCVDAPLPARSAGPSRTTAGPGGGETILLCEDDDIVRRLTTTVLRGAGYTVLEGASGDEAVELSRQNEGRIDLLITDIIMPEMNGRALADALRALRPGIAVLYMSGYAQEVISQQAAVEPGVEFLTKPFEPRQLLTRVREILDARVEQPSAGSSSQHHAP